MLWTNDMQLSESTTLILLLQQFSMSKKNIFPEPDQDHDTKKAWYITLLQADWFIAQNEHFRLAITTRNSCHKNSESSEGTLMLNIKFYSQKYDFNCLVIANIRSELPYLLVYKSTPHFQGQKSNFSSFREKQMKFTPTEISQNVNFFFLRMY